MVWLDSEHPSLCILGALEELDDLPGGHEFVFCDVGASTELILCPCLNFLGRWVITTLDWLILVLKHVKILLLHHNGWLFSILTNLNELKRLQFLSCQVRLFFDNGHFTLGGEEHSWMKDGLEQVIASLWSFVEWWWFGSPDLVSVWFALAGNPKLVGLLRLVVLEAEIVAILEVLSSDDLIASVIL